MASARRKVVCRIHFGRTEVPGFEVERVADINWGLPFRQRRVHAVLCANPSTADLGKLFLWKLLSFWKLRVAVFDLILKRPETPRERLLAALKSRFIKAVDMFLMIHKDWKGYEHHYGVRPERSVYVPFKANNIDLSGLCKGHDGDYIVSCGASQRDFNTLLKAVNGTGYKTVILLSEAAARAHRAVLDEDLLGENVEVVRKPLDREGYNALIAASRFVVIPILPGTIQPAGISVLLEAMALGKPVIVTRGTSTIGIVEDEMAEVVEPGDSKALRCAIARLWDDSRRRAQFSRNGQQFALALSGSERLASDIHKQFLDLCNR
jgi:glycosyltransferase involved in cell wall biosynthesis